MRVRFAWIIVFGLVASMSGCSGCVETKSDSDNAPSGNHDPGARRQRLIRPGRLHAFGARADGGEGGASPLAVGGDAGAPSPAPMNAGDAAPPSHPAR
jgi:hypothetical protein